MDRNIERATIGSLMVLTTKYQWDQGSERNRIQGILMLYLHEIKTKLSMSKNQSILQLYEVGGCLISLLPTHK